MTYQPIAKCPKLLENWLDLIKSVPSRIHLVSWRILVSNAYFELTGESDEKLIQPPPEFDYGDWQPPTFEQQDNLEKAHENAIQKLKELKQFPKLYDYLFEPEGVTKPENKWDEIRFDVKKYQYENTAHQRYEKFRQMRADIKTIARSCMDYRKRGRFIDNQAILKALGGQADNRYKVDFSINENGKITFESDLIDALKDVDDAKRLRICPICENVFWARRIEKATSKRKEAETCQKKCSNNYQRRKQQIGIWEERLEKEFEKLENFRSRLSPTNNLIVEQQARVNKILVKLNPAKLKNGVTSQIQSKYTVKF